MIETMWHTILHYGFYLLLGILTGGALIGLYFLYGISIRTYRRILHKYKPEKIPSWKIIMGVVHPDLGRPRYLSLHTLAAILGRKDLLKLAKEMKKSHEVNISFCNVVKSPVFYLRGFNQYNDSEIWKRLKDFIKANPYPTVRGFRADGYWTGGDWGRVKWISSTKLNEPFIDKDYIYANKIIAALEAKGRKAAIEKYTISPSSY